MATGEAQNLSSIGNGQTRGSRVNEDRVDNSKIKSDKQDKKNQLASLPTMVQTPQAEARPSLSLGSPLTAPTLQPNETQTEREMVSHSSSDEIAPSACDLDQASIESAISNSGDRSSRSAVTRSTDSLAASVATGPIAFAVQVKEPRLQMKVEHPAPTSQPLTSDDHSREVAPGFANDASINASMNADDRPSSPQPEDGNMRGASHDSWIPDGGEKPAPTAEKPEVDSLLTRSASPSKEAAGVGGQQTQWAAARKGPDAPEQAEDTTQQTTTRVRQSIHLEGSAEKQPPAASEVALNAAAPPARTDTNPTGDARATRATDNLSARFEDPTISETNTAARPQSAKEISLRLNSGDSQTVDIKLADQGGALRVAVRTPDPDLAHNLQSGLSDLVHRLDRKGFEAEAWSPADSSGAQVERSSQSSNDDSLSQRNARDPRDGAQHGNSEQQHNGRNRPKWVAELEQKLGLGTAE